MFHKKLQTAVASVMLVLCAFAAPLAAAQNKRVAFSLRSLDGGTISSQSLRGQVAVLAFGASWLPLSRRQMTGLRSFVSTYQAKGVAIYWVSVDSENPKSKNYADDDTLRAFARKSGLNLTVLRDPDGATSAKFGVDQLPSLVILDKSGSSVGDPIGGLDPEGKTDQLEDLVKEALARN